jgi:predicted ATPase
MCVPRTFDSGDGDYVNVADVGLAVSTVLPVLVALIQADPGQLVYIEQPELHLHPKAQVLMAELLADAANRGVRLVIETHSSLLLQGILTCVAKGAITPDKVALHWFTRNDDGVTKVKTADLDAQGRFGDWPADFDSVEMKASNDYLDAMETTSIAS